MYNEYFNGLLLEWEPYISDANNEKYSVSFKQAAMIFLDEYAIIFDDPDRPGEEGAFILIGEDTVACMHIVIRCNRIHGGFIQLLEARFASKQESKFYREKQGRRRNER